MTNTLKFFYNGIKAAGGELQKCWYSTTTLTSYPQGTITIYAKHYKRFSKEVRENFTVENETDSMTDYFDEDKIRVTPSHPLYKEVHAAWVKQDQKRVARAFKNKAKIEAAISAHVQARYDATVGA